MADVKYLPPEPVRPELPGGSTRPSVLVDLGDLPTIRRRVELDERLLNGTCAFDEPSRFGPDDLDLLLVITQERFGGESALPRRQAVLALAGIESGAAVERLTELALNPVEHDGIRLAALAALPGERSEELARELAEDLSPGVRRYARWLLGERPERPPKPAQVPSDPTTGLDELPRH